MKVGYLDFWNSSQAGYPGSTQTQEHKVGRYDIITDVIHKVTMHCSLYLYYSGILHVFFVSQTAAPVNPTPQPPLPQPQPSPPQLGMYMYSMYCGVCVGGCVRACVCCTCVPMYFLFLYFSNSSPSQSTTSASSHPTSAFTISTRYVRTCTVCMDVLLISSSMVLC